MIDTRKDYILRIVEQAVLCLQKILGLKAERRDEEAFGEIERATLLLLGDDRDIVSLVDPASAARILGDVQRVWLYARILAEQGDLERRCGSPSANQTDARAIAMVEETMALMRRHAPTADLEEPRALLAKLHARASEVRAHGSDPIDDDA